MGLTFTLGNAGGIVASQIYRTQDAPRYQFGHGITLAFSAVSAALVFIPLFSLALISFVLGSRRCASSAPSSSTSSSSARTPVGTPSTALRLPPLPWARSTRTRTSRGLACTARRRRRSSTWATTCPRSGTSFRVGPGWRVRLSFQKRSRHQEGDAASSVEYDQSRLFPSFPFFPFFLSAVVVLFLGRPVLCSCSCGLYSVLLSAFISFSCLSIY